MKNELDALMQAQNIDALLITGAGDHNPAMVYMTGGAHLTNADLIKKRGETGILFHGPMERDEAARSGMHTRSFNQYSLIEFIKISGGDRLLAMGLRYQKMLGDAGVTSGRVALYGQTDLGNGYAIFSTLQKIMPEVTFVGYLPVDIFAGAMATKDHSEVERIRKMGQITTAVVAQTADFLTGHKTRGDVLIRPDGEPLTIGEVKGNINLWLAQRGAENPEGTIFAIGRDAGVPHSSGTATDVMRLGQTIVYDIFPCEIGGGYFYDFTRTWCLGYAPDAAVKLHEEVLSVYNTVVGAFKPNTAFSDYQRMTCELFEGMGHPTIMSKPDTLEGYVHSLGHGVGLHIHERPMSGALSTSLDMLVPGVIITAEPGLYYPERGLGMRIEDTLWLNPQGNFEILAPYPKDLVLPIKG